MTVLAFSGFLAACSDAQAAAPQHVHGAAKTRSGFDP